jgi:colicin import membrane protein
MSNAEASSTGLIVVEKTTAMAVFTQADQLDPLLAKITEKAKSLVPDTSTAKGRKEIASIAYQVARTKTYLDSLGKELVDDLKEVPKKIDASRKKTRDYLDMLAMEVRKPLDDWEADQARIEADKKAIEAAESLAKQIENDHEIGLLMNREFDRERAARIAAEAEAKRLHEERITREAKEAAEAAAAKAIEDAQRQAREAKEAAERAETARKEAEARAAQERIDAEARADQARKDAETRAEQQRLEAIAQAERERKSAAEREEQAKKQAIEQERLRVEAENARAAAELARREADTAHKTKINRLAVADLIKAGLTDEQAKLVVRAVAKGSISNIAINY